MESGKSYAIKLTMPSSMVSVLGPPRTRHPQQCSHGTLTRLAHTACGSLLHVLDETTHHV